MTRSARFVVVFALALALFDLSLILSPVRAQDPAPPGACRNPDGRWVTEAGGCKNVATNVVWSQQMGGYFTHGYLMQTACPNLVEGGYDDWRVPTLPEFQAAAADGAFWTLVHTYYRDLPQPSYTGAFYWTSTYRTARSGKPDRTAAYGVRMSDGAFQLFDTGRDRPGDGQILFAHCVRQP